MGILDSEEEAQKKAYSELCQMNRELAAECERLQGELDKVKSMFEAQGVQFEALLKSNEVLARQRDTLIAALERR
jgi:hypothetical protein